MIDPGAKKEEGYFVHDQALMAFGTIWTNLQFGQRA